MERFQLPSDDKISVAYDEEGEAVIELFIYQGHIDLPLTDKGRDQTHTLANFWLSIGRTFDSIITSPLKRAKETKVKYQSDTGRWRLVTFNDHAFLNHTVVSG